MDLAIGIEVTLGSLILSHIYKGLNDLTTMKSRKLSRTVRGPIWMVQVWLVAYYLDIFDWKLNVHILSLSLYGLTIAKSVSTLKSFKDFFSLFYDCSTNCNPYSILPPIIGPSWIKDIFTTENAAINPSSLIWKPILAARDLIYSFALESRKNNYCMSEVYCTYIATQQLDLHQIFLWLITFLLTKVF